MHTELRLSLPALYGFLLVMARVAGAFVFVPLPGIGSSPVTARMVLILAITASLAPVWPVVAIAEPSIGTLAAWLVAEAAFGLTVGVAVSFLNEAMLVAAQAMGLQAGYAFASTVDPTTQADSSVLQVIAQLGASLLFFAVGMDREVIRIFARSLEVYPAGSYGASLKSLDAVLHLGSAMFSTGLRLAMPVLALLSLVDIALALMGRINAQLQLLSLAFPAKMLAALGLLTITVRVFPVVYQTAADHTIKTLEGIFFGR
jgi:flagellar biosynthetic protein FliR